MSAESKTNIVYVNINLTGNLLLGFRKYCGKALPEAADFHLFWAPALTNNVFSIFFSRWPIGTKECPRIYHTSLVLKQLDFVYFR